MPKPRHYRLLIVILLGLLAVGQLPRWINICRGADGLLRTGFGCQCPACGLDEPAATAASACGCGDAGCAENDAGTAADAKLTAGACCAGFKLTCQPITQRNALPRPAPAPQLLHSLPAICAAAIPPPAGDWHTCFQLGHPPGPSQPRLLRTAILLA